MPADVPISTEELEDEVRELKKTICRQLIDELREDSVEMYKYSERLSRQRKEEGDNHGRIWHNGAAYARLQVLRSLRRLRKLYG